MLLKVQVVSSPVGFERKLLAVCDEGIPVHGLGVGPIGAPIASTAWPGFAAVPSQVNTPNCPSVSEGRLVKVKDTVVPALIPVTAKRSR